MKKDVQLILMRHGESMWNKANRFTGWIDIPLSYKGIEEALEAGKKIQEISIDQIFVSSLIRAQMSAMLAMSVNVHQKTPVVIHTGEGKLEEWSKNYGEDEGMIPVVSAWQLNERMYGQLQGLNKAKTIEKFGADQVKIWRRSYDVAPPSGESLELTAKRTIPYFKEKILPQLHLGKTIFIAAHGNSLRSIVMEIEQLSKEQILEFEMETGVPLIYQFEEGRLTKQLP